MKTILALLLVAIMAFGIALPVSAQNPLTLDLIIDGGDNPTDIGDVTFSWDGTNATVSCTVDAPWEVVETHVYVGAAPPDKSAPGKFPYTADSIIPVSGDVYVAFHAEVRMDTGEVDADGNPIYAYETGWAQSSDPLLNIPIPPGKNWATYVLWDLIP